MNIHAVRDHVQHMLNNSFKYKAKILLRTDKMNLTAVVIFVSAISGSLQLDYVCYFDGSIDITNPDQTKFRYFDVRLGNNNTGCYGEFTANYSHVLFQNCGLGKRITITFFKRNFGVIVAGSYAGPFRVQCHDVPPVDMLASIISHYLIRNNVTVPDTLMDSINASLIVTKMRHVSRSSVYYKDLSFEWVLNTTVLQQFLELETASENTTLTPLETANSPGPTIGINSTAFQHIIETFQNVTSSTSAGLTSSTTGVELPLVNSSSSATGPSVDSTSTLSSISNDSRRSPTSSTTSSTDDQISTVSSTTTQSTNGDKTSSAAINSTVSPIVNNTTTTSSTTTKHPVVGDTSTEK